MEEKSVEERLLAIEAELADMGENLPPTIEALIECSEVLAKQLDKNIGLIQEDMKSVSTCLQQIGEAMPKLQHHVNDLDARIKALEEKTL